MKTHPLNVSYLVAGLVFLGIAASWALRESGVVDVGDVQWLLPLTLIVAGVVGLVAFAAKGRRGRGAAGGTDAPGSGRQDGYDTEYSYYENDTHTDREGELR